jgi:dTDP-4-dehydrorhamnose reductase
MTNILVTGSNGQVGSELQALSKKYPYNFFFSDKDSVDITDKKCLEEFIKLHSIDTIVNPAAYTNVDKAEENTEDADKINHIGVRNLAELSKLYTLKLIHISTDYVFDGTNHKPYSETDTAHPTSVYGDTKLKGENALIEINPQNSVIIRTSWVYSSFGANFVKTMLRLGKERDSLGVIYDQIGTPTYAKDLAQAILDILPNIQNSKVEIYHYSNEGVLSWYDFAKEIMKMAKIECQINPIESKEYPTPVKRPHYSLLNKTKIKKTFEIEIPYWKDSLSECLRTLGAKR